MGERFSNYLGRFGLGLVCLIWSNKTEIGRFESKVCSLVPGLVRLVPAIGQFPIQAIEFFGVIYWLYSV